MCWWFGLFTWFIIADYGKKLILNKLYAVYMRIGGFFIRTDNADAL